MLLGSNVLKKYYLKKKMIFLSYQYLVIYVIIYFKNSFYHFVILINLKFINLPQTHLNDY